MEEKIINNINQNHDNDITNNDSQLSRVEENIACPIINEDDGDLLVSVSLWQVIKQSALEWIIIIALAFLISLFINECIIETTEVVGKSMDPTLKEGERLFVNKFIYKISDPKRGDIVIFLPDSEGKNYVKRIIALPGETIDINNGKVYINDKVLEETYLDGVRTYNLGSGKVFPYTLGSEEYFALGDNRSNSYDCRSEEIGALTKSLMRGKVIGRIFPFEDMKWFGKVEYNIDDARKNDEESKTFEVQN